MKGKDLLNFLGCCVIAVIIVMAISSYMISNLIPQIPRVPDSLSVSVQDATQQYGNYLTVYEAAAYLGISDTDMNDLINSGKLDSAIYKDGEICIISKQALQEWVNTQIGNG